jgi:hypothetical protein
VKKKSSNKKISQKVSFKDSLLILSNLCRVYHGIRARQSDQKKPQNLETEREKKQQKRAETFLWSKKRDASLSEF